MRTRKEIRDHVKVVTREVQIDNYIEEFINTTLSEMNDPAWAYEQVGLKGYNHLWTFNRRKNTLSVSAETGQLPRDLDKISFIRQTTSPVKLLYIPDEIFYKYIPNPTATGNPTFYRIWEEEGVSTRLAVADTITIKSSSTSDTSSFTVSVVGYDANGILQSEVITLNGTTNATATTPKTFVANRPLRISKSGKTTGDITVMETSGFTTLVVLGAEERSPRFKVIGLYPIPTSALSLYLEYFTRIRLLENDADVPDIDEKWIWVVRLGTMAKVYQYQGKESMFNSTQAMFASGVRSMIKADLQEPDYIPHLSSHGKGRKGVVEFAGEGYGTYGLVH